MVVITDFSIFNFIKLFYHFCRIICPGPGNLYNFLAKFIQSVINTKSRFNGFFIYKLICKLA